MIKERKALSGKTHVSVAEESYPRQDLAVVSSGTGCVPALRCASVRFAVLSSVVNTKQMADTDDRNQSITSSAGRIKLRRLMHLDNS